MAPRVLGSEEGSRTASPEGAVQGKSMLLLSAMASQRQSCHLSCSPTLPQPGTTATSSVARKSTAGETRTRVKVLGCGGAKGRTAAEHAWAATDTKKSAS